MTDCVECGLCRNKCPVFKATLNESFSPRGIAKLRKKKLINEVAYLCSLCGACDLNCPLDLKLIDKIIESREKLVEQGFQTEFAKQILENVKKTGNPFKSR